MDKEAIIELYDAAKDKEEQIKLMTKMGFGKKSEILKVLHEEGRALNIEIKKRGPKPKPKEEIPEEEYIPGAGVIIPKQEEIPAEAAGDKSHDDKRAELLPIPDDVRQLLIDELEGIDASINELQEIIELKKNEQQRLETLYKHIVECIKTK